MPSSPTEGGHESVLLHEAVDALLIDPAGVYVDATFGGGGHTRELLRRGTRRVVAFDADPEAEARADLLRTELENPDRFVLVRDNFASMVDRLEELGQKQIQGVLFDLGLSSFQLDTPERGFAFRYPDASLDMRFDNQTGQSAADLINTSSEQDLATLLRDFGEERAAKAIARAIGRMRPITRVGELVDVVQSVLGPPRRGGIHPATRTFQAIRIAINQELEVLQSALHQSAEVLAAGGRLVVLSFHSLEDRIVKQFLETSSRSCICPPEIPICQCDHLATFRRIGKPVRASAEEIQRNPRSRSVVMRTGERLSDEESEALKRETGNPGWRQ